MTSPATTRAPGGYAARHRLIQTALRAVSADYANEHAWADAEAVYADNELALAARDLTHAIDALPADEQPIGWRTRAQEGAPCP